MIHPELPIISQDPVAAGYIKDRGVVTERADHARAHSKGAAHDHQLTERLTPKCLAQGAKNRYLLFNLYHHRLIVTLFYPKENDYGKNSHHHAQYCCVNLHSPEGILLRRPGNKEPGEVGEP